jgi:hypothetical protein
MTERKPPGTSWETWIEAQIRVAMDEGAFDNLPGAGKPLPNLGQEYDPLSRWVKQLVQREQISMLPPSLELLRKVETELAAVEKLHDEATVRCRVVALNVEIAKVGGGAADAPRHAERRSGRGAVAADPLRQSSVALRSHGPFAMAHNACATGDRYCRSAASRNSFGCWAWLRTPLAASVKQGAGI